MGNLRKNLDDSQESLDMQNWVIKYKPMQIPSSHGSLKSDESPFEELDEIARQMTLKEL